MVLTHRGRIGLFRRSDGVTWDTGLWHCITGYLPSCEDPLTQALVEIAEEAGIAAAELELQNTAVVEQHDSEGNVWRIHAFHFQSLTEIVTLNWEHDAAHWFDPAQLGMMRTVMWLGTVLGALSVTGYLQAMPVLTQMQNHGEDTYVEKA
ncbi:NUDIX domain-containing protein [Pandoraea terrae]|uniref:NUDIX domain-containing protein n=1 Tax=Pandoraea terrae TaxID=1537710 RepID=UPI001781CFA1|nr:NUDIX domain-containing protein [Pandoraea terrae]